MSVIANRTMRSMALLRTLRLGCAACGYLVDGAEGDAAAPADRCPECGTAREDSGELLAERLGSAAVRLRWAAFLTLVLAVVDATAVMSSTWFWGAEFLIDPPDIPLLRVLGPLSWLIMTGLYWKPIVLGLAWSLAAGAMDRLVRPLGMRGWRSISGILLAASLASAAVLVLSVVDSYLASPRVMGGGSLPSLVAVWQILHWLTEGLLLSFIVVVALLVRTRSSLAAGGRTNSARPGLIAILVLLYALVHIGLVTWRAVMPFLIQRLVNQSPWEDVVWAYWVLAALTLLPAVSLAAAGWSAASQLRTTAASVVGERWATLRRTELERIEPAARRGLLVAMARSQTLVAGGLAIAAEAVVMALPPERDGFVPLVAKATVTVAFGLLAASSLVTLRRREGRWSEWLGLASVLAAVVAGWPWSCLPTAEASRYGSASSIGTGTALAMVPLVGIAFGLATVRAAMAVRSRVGIVFAGLAGALLVPPVSLDVALLRASFYPQGIQGTLMNRLGEAWGESQAIEPWAAIVFHLLWIPPLMVAALAVRSAVSRTLRAETATS